MFQQKSFDEERRTETLLNKNYFNDNALNKKTSTKMSNKNSLEQKTRTKQAWPKEQAEQKFLNKKVWSKES